MKKSLKFFIKAIITLALFTSGAILGSLLPEYLKLYALIVGIACAIIFFILVGFNGHQKNYSKNSEFEEDDEED